MASEASIKQVQEIYIAYYGRPADSAGLEYWADRLDAEGTLDSIIGEFGNSAEALTLFGLSDLKEENQAAVLQNDAQVDAVLNKIYRQLFNRDGDSAGVEYYRGELQAGNITLASVALDVLNGATGGDATVLENKYIAADYFTDLLVTDVSLKAAYDDPDAGRAYLGAVTAELGDYEADAQALLYPDGAITLTQGIDVVSGNVINAPRDFTPGGTDQVNSLDDDDVLTGTGDNPTLNWSAVNDADTGDLDIQPTLNGIQTINIDARTDGTAQLDLQDSTGVQNVNVMGIDDGATVIVDQIQSAEDLKLSVNDSNEDSAVAAFLFEGSALAGAADSVDLTLNDVNLASVFVEDEDGNGGQGLETLNLMSVGDSNSTNLLAVEGLQTLNITGDQSIRIGDFANVAGSLNTIDASTMTESVSLNLLEEFGAIQDGTSGTSVALSVTTGSANDTVTASAIGSTDSLDMGDGVDTLRTHSAGTAEVIDDALDAGDIVNVETLDVRKLDNGDATLTADTSKVGGLTNIVLRNEDNDGSSATFVLNEVAATMPIKVLHSATNSNALNDTSVVVNLANANGASDTVAVEIASSTNSDPRFNMALDADGKNAAGVADGGRVENITLNDADDEDNTVALTQVAEHRGTITLTGGQTGKFLDLDATANLYGRDQSGGMADGNDGIQDVGANAADHIVAATVDASAHVGNVTVRVSESATVSTTKDQTILMGSGNDTVIFDNLGDSTAGLSILDTVVGGAGSDTLAIDGVGQVSLGASEWTNVSGMDNIHLVGNGEIGQAAAVATPANATGPDGLLGTADDVFASAPSAIITTAGVVQAAYNPIDNAGYRLILTNELVDSTDAGNVINIVNDSGETVAAANTDIESSAVIDARALNPGNSFTYNGEENDAVGSVTSDGATKDVFIFNDASMNGTHIIDGGDENTNIRNTNSDIIEIYNTAIVTAGDLANIKNVGEIRFRNDQATDQNLTLKLTDAVLDMFDTSQTATVAAPETIRLTSPNEDTNVGNKVITLDLSDVTQGKFVIDASTLGSETTLQLTNPHNVLVIPPSNPTFTIADVTVAEDAGNATVTITRDDATAPASIEVSTADGSATAGADYTAVANQTVNFATGATTATVNVAITDDATSEANETFTVNLSNASIGTIGDASATVTINDNDGNLITVTSPSTNTFTGTAAPDIFSFDAEGARATADNTQVTVAGFTVADDVLRVNLPNATGTTTLDQLVGQQGVVSAQANPFAGSTLINFGPDANGDVVTIDLQGVTDLTTVNVDIV